MKHKSQRELRIHLVYLLFFVLLCNPGCMVTRVVVSNNCDTPVNFNTNKKTTWNFFWGLVQPIDVTPKCESGKLNKVEAKTNFGFILISTLTLGIVVPQRVEWCCAPTENDPGTIDNKK